jgi:hypothetical protein
VLSRVNHRLAFTMAIVEFAIPEFYWRSRTTTDLYLADEKSEPGMLSAVMYCFFSPLTA